jgi:hypothetical protein
MEQDLQEQAQLEQGFQALVCLEQVQACPEQARVWLVLAEPVELAELAAFSPSHSIKPIPYHN